MKKNSLIPSKAFKGFTLIELLVVVAIIGILMSLATVSFQATRKASRDAKRRADLQTIAAALEAFKSDTGHYPYGNENSFDWESGMIDPDDECCDTADYPTRTLCPGGCYHPLNTYLVNKGYIGKLPVDPINTYGSWGCGNSLVYQYNDTNGTGGAYGQTYMLAATEEAKGASDCLCNLFGDRLFQICNYNP